MSAEQEKRRLRVASYNIHSWRGMDGQHAPERILGVIDSLNADVLGLQEVISPREMGMPCSMADMAGEHGYHVTFGQTMLREDSRYGNAILSKREPSDVQRHDISVPGREPRGALEVSFNYGPLTLKVVCTHLGLRKKERVSQIDALLPVVTADTTDITILMGDFNDWFGLSKIRRILRRTFGPHRAPRTFPSTFPIFSLDKIHVSPERRLASLRAMVDPATREASDHLPVLATVDIAE